MAIRRTTMTSMILNIIDYGAENFPVRKHYDDMGADVFSTVDCVLLAHQMVDIPLGFGIELPTGFAGYVEPRGSAGKRGLLPVSNPIDSGYRGEIHAVIWNVSDAPQYIKKGERIAQLVIRPGDLSEFRVIKPEEASSTERGTNCYGSTGR